MTPETPDSEIEPSVSEAKTVKLDPELDPEVIIKAMTEIIHAGQPISGIPEETVTKLLQLRGVKGHKLVFLRSELFQIFGIMDRKLRGEDRL